MSRPHRARGARVGRPARAPRLRRRLLPRRVPRELAPTRPGIPAFLHLEEAGGDVVFPLLVREAPEAAQRRDHAVRLRRPRGGGPAAADGALLGVSTSAGARSAASLRRSSVSTRSSPTSATPDRTSCSSARRHDRLAAGPAGPLRGDAGQPPHVLPQGAQGGSDRPHPAGAARPRGVRRPVRGDDAAARATASTSSPRATGARSTGPLRERVLLAEALHEGEIVASALCFATPPWLHYHLSAASDRGRALGAANLVLYQTASGHGRGATSASTWAAARAASRTRWPPSSGASIRAGAWSVARQGRPRRGGLPRPDGGGTTCPGSSRPTGRRKA